MGDSGSCLTHARSVGGICRISFEGRERRLEPCKRKRVCVGRQRLCKDAGSLALAPVLYFRIGGQNCDSHDAGQPLGLVLEMDIVHFEFDQP